MKKIPLFLSIAMMYTTASKAQNDSLKYETYETLDEIVVSTQIEPQSIRKSIHNVRVISREDIQNQAATTLSDVLNQYLKINVLPDNGKGRSTISMVGLDSQYLKILIDNIPVVSDSGLGNSIDLTQINLNDIERIEIVEGSMGVTHGANSVSGIVNIITKRKIASDWQINLSAIEETVGNEYAWSNKGRHIQSIKIAKNIKDRWFVSMSLNRNDFSGFFNDKTGIDYDTSLQKARGNEWLPKQILVGNASLSYCGDRFKLFYKTDYMNERITFYNPIVKSISNYPFDPIQYADDRRYITNRYYHHLNGYGKIKGKVNYNVSVSYQEQERDFEDFKYYFEDKNENDVQRNTYESTKILYSTGQFSNFYTSDKTSLQLGYELVNQQSFASAHSGMFKNENNQGEDVSARFENYDIYSVLEYKPSEKWALRPGARYSYQSRFNDQYAFSFGTRYNVSDKTEMRFGVGRSYRTPNFSEMYTFFVDSNHNLQGNKELIPEQSWSYEYMIRQYWKSNESEKYVSQFSLNYMSVSDRISLALVGTVPTWQYKYINIDDYKMWNATLENTFQFENGEFTLGGSLLGISQKMNTGQITSDGDYLYTYQINSKLIYREQWSKTQWALYFKHQGKQPQYVEETDDNKNPVYVISKTQEYGWLDLSVTKKFLKDQLWMTIGARNLLNVKTINTTVATGNIAHGTASNAISVGYGTSYFLKLEYQLNL